MKLIINGKQEETEGEPTIRELLLTRGVKSPEMVSVEHNGTILTKNDIPSVRVQENDTIEFIYFMGGGSSP